MERAGDRRSAQPRTEIGIVPNARAATDRTYATSVVEPRAALAAAIVLALLASAGVSLEKHPTKGDAAQLNTLFDL